MNLKIKTSPDMTENAPNHQAAVAAGREHFLSWSHNVEDRFKNMSVDEIKNSLRETANPFAVCFENWIGDFNISTGMRNANAFNAKEAFYIGNKKWDKRGAVGVYNYTDINWISSIDDFVKLKEKYVFIGIDNVPGSIPMETYEYPKPCLLIFGEESVGLTPTIQELCDEMLFISQYGSVRSLNAGTASGIAMYDFVRKLNL